jgi:predicted enzyme related to lactoylglutathione lyase
MYVRVDDLEDAVARVAAAGGTIVLGPLDAGVEGRLAAVTDPAGIAFGLWQAAERPGAQLVKEPGSWAMSAVHTPDVDAAQAFYGAVLGWRLEPMPGAPFALWRLPGHVGGEPGQPIPRDVVAVAAPIDPGSDVPPHWAVNFRVEDVDATAEQAVALGGSLLDAAHGHARLPQCGHRRPPAGRDRRQRTEDALTRHAASATRAAREVTRQPACGLPAGLGQPLDGLGQSALPIGQLGELGPDRRELASHSGERRWGGRPGRRVRGRGRGRPGRRQVIGHHVVRQLHQSPVRDVEHRGKPSQDARRGVVDAAGLELVQVALRDVGRAAGGLE